MLMEYIKEKSKMIDRKLEEIMVEQDEIPVIYEAIRYSVRAGGKRIRPVMCLMATDLFGGDEQKTLPFACSIELIHTYSLIHDDLPCMDNDDFRRGQPANHKKFGEDFATLAGDALLNLAYENVIEEALRQGSKESLQAANIIARGAGIRGMVGGQCIDVFYEGKEIDLALLNKMYSLKTGQLLIAPLLVGTVLSGGCEKDMEIMHHYGSLIGLAFQITDDILDEVGDQAELGKPIGSDKENDKSTYVKIYGLNRAKEIAHELTEDAKKIISCYGDRAQLLCTLADYIYNRKK